MVEPAETGHRFTASTATLPAMGGTHTPGPSRRVSAVGRMVGIGAGRRVWSQAAGYRGGSGSGRAAW